MSHVELRALKRRYLHFVRTGQIRRARYVRRYLQTIARAA